MSEHLGTAGTGSREPGNIQEQLESEAACLGTRRNSWNREQRVFYTSEQLEKEEAFLGTPRKAGTGDSVPGNT
jgi:hypothetical protein